jgi:hypothetical protein
MRVRLKPGQRGTKHLSKQYGDQLVCVRYRYNENSRKRYTTGGLLSKSTKTWKLPYKIVCGPGLKTRIIPDKNVTLKIKKVYSSRCKLCI